MMNVLADLSNRHTNNALDIIRTLEFDVTKYFYLLYLYWVDEVQLAKK